MNTSNKKGLGFVFGIFSAIFWGTNGTFCTLLSNLGINALSIAILAPTFNLIFFSILLTFSNKSGFKIPWKYFRFIVSGRTGFSNY